MDARTFLTADEAKALADDVRAVEKRTGAELVLVVATESGRYDRAETVVGAIGAGALLLVVDAVMVGDAWSGGAPLWAQSLAVGAGLLAGSIGASVFPALRRPFVPAAEIDEEVERAALAAYAAAGVGETTHGAGLLLYFSLRERRLHVLVDAAVRKVVDDGFAARLVEVATAELKKGARAAAIRAAVEEAGRALDGKLPTRPDAAGELPDPIVVVHPR